MRALWMVITVICTLLTAAGLTWLAFKYVTLD